MKSYVQSGDTVTAVAPYDVASGAGALIGSLFGVAIKDVASGVAGEFKTTGVFTLKAKATDTPAAWAKVYWDNTNKELTTTSSGNSLVGMVTEAKTNGPVVATVRLNGISI